MNQMRVATGGLLAAAPDMLDENFMHTVVLMTAHGDEGAHGLVMNRPTPLTIDKLMPSHPILSRLSFPVHAGGPVGLDILQLVHRAPHRVPGSVELAAGVWLGGDLDAVARWMEECPEEAARDLRVVLGHSGWSAGQLEGELAQGAWLPAKPDPEALFGGEPIVIWRRVLRSLGDHASGLSDMPPDVSWN